MTVYQRMRQGGHTGIYGFLSVNVMRFGQISNEGGFGSGSHGVFRVFVGFCSGT